MGYSKIIMGVLRFYSILNLIGTCLLNLRDSTYVRVETRYPTPHYPISVFYWGVRSLGIFTSPWHWRLLACTGAFFTAAPNPSANPSSRGLRQCCLCLVWADSSRGGSNSIVLSVVHFCLFYFSSAPPLHPICPACNDRRQGPSPSHFPSSITSVVTPLLHCPCLACAGPAPLSPCPCLIDAINVSVPPSPPPPLRYAYLLTIAAYVHPSHWKCIGSVLSCRSCWRWWWHQNSKPSALKTLTPMPSLHVLLPPPPQNAATTIFNCRLTQPPNGAASPPFSNTTATPPPSSNTISSWFLLMNIQNPYWNPDQQAQRVSHISWITYLVEKM